jgi:hypothetical protein
MWDTLFLYEKYLRMAYLEARGCSGSSNNGTTSGYHVPISQSTFDENVPRSTELILRIAGFTNVRFKREDVFDISSDLVANLTSFHEPGILV